MAKYIIIKDNRINWYYVSKKLFGLFDIGTLGHVSGVGGFTLEECEKDLRKALSIESETIIKELDIK